MNTLLNKIFSFIKNAYKKLTYRAKVYIPIAINVVEAIKTAMDSNVPDIVLAITSAVIPNIPTAQITLVENKLKEFLPKLLLELNLVNDLGTTTDVNAQLQKILDTLKLSSDDVKAERYHTLASKILVILSDGKVTWSEAVMFTEWYYQTYVKK